MDIPWPMSSRTSFDWNDDANTFVFNLLNHTYFSLYICRKSISCRSSSCRDIYQTLDIFLISYFCVTLRITNILKTKHKRNWKIMFNYSSTFVIGIIGYYNRFSYYYRSIMLLGLHRFQRLKGSISRKGKSGYLLPSLLHSLGNFIIRIYLFVHTVLFCVLFVYVNKINPLIYNVLLRVIDIS